MRLKIGGKVKSSNRFVYVYKRIMCIEDYK